MFISDQFGLNKDVSAEPKSMCGLVRPTSHIISINHPPISQGLMFDSSALNLFDHAFHFGGCPN